MTSHVPDEFVALADFQRDAASHAQRIRATRRPQVLTIEGRPELVVSDADSYEQLLELADQADTVAALREALASFERGEGRPAREAFAKLRQKHGIPR